MQRENKTFGELFKAGFIKVGVHPRTMFKMDLEADRMQIYQQTRDGDYEFQYDGKLAYMETWCEKNLKRDMYQTHKKLLT